MFWSALTVWPSGKVKVIESGNWYEMVEDNGAYKHDR